MATAIRAQVAAANGDPDSLFTEEALEAIFAATDGSPRLINQLGDQLMWMIAETGISQLDGNLVQQAWSELQQLPAPWNTQAKESLGVEVEFGELSNESGEFAEVVFEDDCYEAEYDDDRPASIPIHSSRANPHDSHESTETEAIDVTEQLLSQLHELDSANEEQAPEALEPQPVRNPFEESFESEELVLDQYSRFESMLLAEAPRVFNPRSRNRQ